MSRRTETAYKAESPGKSAQHDKALDSGDTVNAAVAWSRFTFLSGETCPVSNSLGSGARHGNMTWDGAGVSRGHIKREETSPANRERLTPPKGRTQRREEPL